MASARAFLLYVVRSLIPLARTPGLVGWARWAMTGLVALVAVFGWVIPTDSPLLWITLVAIGLAALFAISGFAAYQDAHREFPRIALDPGTVTYDSASNEVWVADLHITNREPKHKVSLSLSFSAWTETADRINHLWLFPVRGDLSDPINIGPEEGVSGDLAFSVSGEVGDGPTGYTLTISERVTRRAVFLAPFPSSYPPTLRDREKPMKARRV